MNNRLLFLMLTVFSCFLAWSSNFILISDSIYFSTLGEQMSFEQIEKMITNGKKWAWLGYGIIPIIYLIKLLLVTLCLSIGTFFSIDRLEFKKNFSVTLVAEFVFLLVAFLKILWFALIQTDYTLKDLQLFYPLSALNFFDYNHLATWWVYPLQTFNVFEIVYWLLLAKGIKEIINKSFEESLGLVLMSYGTALVLWVATVMFLTVNASV
jgi:fumarate reductase subunit D